MTKREVPEDGDPQGNSAKLNQNDNTVEHKYFLFLLTTLRFFSFGRL
ncbi:MAG: hypothetical protein QXU18_03255 [Thermoplasmatales archaeon]